MGRCVLRWLAGGDGTALVMISHEDGRSERHHDHLTGLTNLTRPGHGGRGGDTTYATEIAHHIIDAYKKG
jgi:hypothetical protein